MKGAALTPNNAMKSKNYIYTNKKHADKGVMASILGLISLVCLGLITYYAFVQRGTGMERLASAMLISCIFSLAGLALGIMALLEKDTFRVFSILGLVMNGAVLGLIGWALYYGNI